MTDTAPRDTAPRDTALRDTALRDTGMTDAVDHCGPGTFAIEGIVA
jgi:hypothetical protein